MILSKSDILKNHQYIEKVEDVIMRKNNVGILELCKVVPIEGFSHTDGEMEMIDDGKEKEVVKPELVSPAAKIVSAIFATATNPNAENIVADIELAISLVKKFKIDLAGVKPSVSKIVKLLF